MTNAVKVIIGWRTAIALLAAASTGCSYLQYLPLVKRQIVTKAQGARRPVAVCLDSIRP